MKIPKFFTADLDLTPLDRAAFLRGIGIYLLAQAGVLTPTLYIYWSGYQEGNADFILFGTISLVVLQMILTLVCVRKRLLYRRLIDIYPTHRFPRFVLLEIWLLFTPFGVPLLVFLATKKLSLNSEPPFVFRRAGWTTICIFIFILLLGPGFGAYALLANGRQFALSKPPHMSRIGYIFMDPTNWYLTSLGDEVGSIVDIKESLKGISQPSEVLSRLQEHNRATDLSTTGMILELAMVVMKHMENKKAQKGAVVLTSENEFALNLMQDMVTITEAWEMRTLPPFRFNPISVFNPFGAVELAFLTAVSVPIDFSVVDPYIGKIVPMLEKLERNLSTEKAQNKPELARKAALLRSRIEASRSFRLHRSLVSSWFAKLVWGRFKK